eukprot:3803066-Rhodomonas_salina.1
MCLYSAIGESSAITPHEIRIAASTIRWNQGFRIMSLIAPRRLIRAFGFAAFGVAGGMQKRIVASSSSPSPSSGWLCCGSSFKSASLATPSQFIPRALSTTRNLKGDAQVVVLARHLGDFAERGGVLQLVLQQVRQPHPEAHLLPDTVHTACVQPRLGHGFGIFQVHVVS